jgi:mannonate dehydratase
MQIAGVESHPVPAEKIKLGIEGRDEELENYIAAIKALANVGIPVLCYNFMAGWAGTGRKSMRRSRRRADHRLRQQAAKAQGLTRGARFRKKRSGTTSPTS